MREPIHVLDLFSGIGGFTLGLERTGGFKVSAFCEIEDFPRRILAKHWPTVPIYTDVRVLTGERLKQDGIAADVICGGFPCQDLSVAGRGLGIDGPRTGLWRQYIRLIGELRPSYVLMENVSALLERGFGRVLGELATLRYDAEWHCIPASCLGAPHARDRLWIVAYPSSERLEGHKPTGPRLRLLPGKTSAESRNEIISFGEFESQFGVDIRMGHGIPREVDEIKALGNAVIPQIPEMIGHAILVYEESRKSEGKVS